MRGGRPGEGRGKAWKRAWAQSPDTFPAGHLGESPGLGMESEGAKFDLGFCGLDEALLSLK